MQGQASVPSVAPTNEANVSESDMFLLKRIILEVSFM